VKGNDTIFNEADLTFANFTGFTLINASSVKLKLDRMDMSRAILDKANFTNANLYFANFDGSELSESIFDGSLVTSGSLYKTNLMATKWMGTYVMQVDFSYANLHSAVITDDQIRRATKMFGITLPDGRQGVDTNLLQNGDAEGQNGKCETSPWHVDSMIAETFQSFLLH
jgi:uncharacterized protein YjbI with pentapeptide repeats